MMSTPLYTQDIFNLRISFILYFFFFPCGNIISATRAGEREAQHSLFLSPTAIAHTA